VLKKVPSDKNWCGWRELERGRGGGEILRETENYPAGKYLRGKERGYCQNGSGFFSGGRGFYYCSAYINVHCYWVVCTPSKVKEVLLCITGNNTVLGGWNLHFLGLQQRYTYILQSYAASMPACMPDHAQCWAALFILAATSGAVYLRSKPRKYVYL
jgi:hypothetical protein